MKKIHRLEALKEIAELLNEALQDMLEKYHIVTS